MASCVRESSRRRSAVALAVAAVVTFLSCGYLPAAEAEPVATASYTAGASADVLGVTATVGALSVTDLRLAHADAGASSASGSSATSSNVKAALLALPSIQVASSAVSVPATQTNTATKSGSLAGVGLNVGLQANLGVLDYNQTATWNGASCLPGGGYFSHASTQAAGLSVGVLGTSIVSTGDVSVDTSTTTTTTSSVHDTRRTSATAKGSVAGLSLLGGAITVSALDPVMTTTSGSSTATISSSAVTVTSGGSTVTLVPGQTLNLGVGLQAVSLTLAPTSIGSVGGTYSTAFLKVAVSGLGLATVNLDVLPLSVSATAPASSIECDTSATIAITAPTAGQTVATATPTITGTSDILSGTVNLALDGGGAVPVSTTASGGWSYTPTVPLADGPHTAVVTGTDSAGNSASATRTFTVDTAGPELAITSPTAGQATADSTPTITGTSDILSGTVNLTLDGRSAVPVNTSASGAWNYTPTVPLADGSRTVVVSGSDAAGNTTTVSRTFTVDTTAAVAITSPVNGSTIGQPRPTLAGTSDLPSSTVQVSVDGGAAQTVSTDSAGDWSYPLGTDLADGPHTVTVTGADALGNTANATSSFTVDTVGPAVAITAPATGSTIRNPQPAITGTSSLPNATLQLTVDGATTPVSTDGDGTWSHTPASALADGPHTASVSATDGLGHTATATSSFTVDSHASIAITAPVDGSVTDETRPVVSGTSDIVNGTVTVSIDGVGSVVGTDGAGDWSFQPVSGLADGPHAVTVAGSDAAGNPASASVGFTVDSSAPVVSVAAPAEGSFTNSRRPVISGGSDVLNGSIVLVIDGGPGLSVATGGSGAWSYTPVADLGDGPHAVTATATDGFGRSSSAQTHFTVDTAASVVIESPGDGALLNTRTPLVSGGSDAPNSTVSISVDGGPAVTLDTDGAGGWVWTPPAPGLADGPHTFTAAVTDAAGNTATDSVSVTVDASAPAIAITSPANGSVIGTDATTVSGTSDVVSGSILLALDGAAAVTVATNATGGWSYPVSGLADGPHLVAVSASDAAGNTGADTSGFTVDTTAPVLTITAPADGSTVADATPSILGTSDLPDSTITVQLDSQPPVTINTDGNGTWSYTPPTALADGPHTITVSGTDAAGNTGSTSSTFTLDTHAEIQITAPTDGALLADPRPQISGDSDITNGTLTLRLDGGTPTSVSTDSAGRWSYTPAVDLADGPHTAAVSGTDAAGNPASDQVSFSIDTTAPQVQITAPVDGSTIADPSPQISGTSDVLSGRITLSIDGGTAAPVSTDAAGAWSYPAPALADGEHTVEVTATAVAGSTTATSTFTVDTRAHVAIASPTDGSLLDTRTPLISGSSDAPNSTVSISVDGGPAMSVPTNPAGDWTWTPTAPGLGDGAHSVAVSVRDAAGNTASDSVSFAVDATAPVVRIDTPADGSEIATAAPVISGGSDVVSGTLLLALDGAPAVAVSTDAGGDWSYPATGLADGPHTVAVTGTDAAGNSGSALTSFTVDTTAPVVTITAPPALGNDPTPTIAGTSDLPDSTVQVVIDSGDPVTVATDADGDWTLTSPPLSDGPHRVTVTGSDEAGNSGTDTADFTLDTVPPTVRIVTPADGSTGNDPTPTISGTSDLPNADVSLVIDDAPAVTVPTDGAGNWTYTPQTGLADGPHTITVSATDPAGNRGSDSGAMTVDTTGPAIAITAPANGSSTNDSTPTITGTSAGSTGTITLTLDRTTVTVRTAPDGTWSWTPRSQLAEGPHTITAVAVDSLGNPAQAASTFTVDLTAPAIAITSPANGSQSENAAPSVTGTSTVPSGTVQLLLDGQAWGSTGTDSAGGWSFTPTAALAVGSHTIQATVADPAGNPATATTTYEVLTPLSVLITFPAAGSALNDRTPTITGNAQSPDTMVSLVLDGGAPILISAGAGHPTSIPGTAARSAMAPAATGMLGWSYTVTSPLADGQHTATATVTDQRGRTATSTTVFTLDTVAPTVRITAPADGSTTTRRRPAITGTSDVISGTIRLTLDSGAAVTVATDARGAWSYTPGSDLSLADHAVVVTATDSAGNVGRATSTFTVKGAVAGETANAGKTGTTGSGGGTGSGSGSLARTGADLGLSLGLAVLLLTSGAALIRRRRPRQE